MGEVLPLPSPGDVFTDVRGDDRTMRASYHQVGTRQDPGQRARRPAARRRDQRDLHFGPRPGGGDGRDRLRRTGHSGIPIHWDARLRECDYGDWNGMLARDYDGHRVLIVGHSATRWALQHLLEETPLDALVAAPFEWREGWTFLLPDGWRQD
jgi:hypothetical protein